MLAFNFLTLLCAAALTAAAAALNASSAFSTRMISSIILRQQGVVSSGQATSTLESGLISLAIQSWISLYAPQGEDDGADAGDFSGYVDTILATISTLDGFTDVAKAAVLPLDRLTVAQ